MPYYSILLDGPFGKHNVVVKADLPEAATLLARIYDGRQIGQYGYSQVGVQSSMSAPRRTTSKALSGKQRHNDPCNEIWVAAA